ncbi:MAG: FG-GAP repeat protein [Limisphaerales bacterium]
MLVCALGLTFTCAAFAADTALLPPDGQPWPRHTIDAGIHGSDGTKLADINGDGLPDIVTSWENEGITRVYLNPGLQQVKERWPQVTIGKSPHAEGRRICGCRFGWCL